MNVKPLGFILQRIDRQHSTACQQPTEQQYDSLFFNNFKLYRQRGRNLLAEQFLGELGLGCLVEDTFCWW